MKLKRAGFFTKVVIIALCVYACISIYSLRSRIAEANRLKEQLQEEVADLAQENAALENELENASDPETLEEIAREKLGLVRPDEKIFYDVSN